MPDISIKVREKVTQVQGTPQIVCGNSDYAVTFDFDSEWNAYDEKTMHAVWMDVRTGELKHYDVEFSESTAVLPAIYNTDRVCIGVYAGDIRTTTPACVPCARCITDAEGDDPYHDDPPPDVYEQLMAYMEEIIEGGGGGTSHVTYPARVTMLTSFYRSAPTIKAPETSRFVPMNRWNFWQETDDNAKTTATVTASPSAPCLLVAAVMHRDETVSISGDGWTKVVDSQAAVNSGGTISQWITVWTKQVQAGSHSVTVTQSSEARMSLKAIALYQAASLTLVDNTVLASVPYTPAAKTGKRRLYALSSIIAATDTIAVTASYSGIDLRSANEISFSAFYDYEPDVSAVPSFSFYSSSYNANSMNALVFDIEEG